MTEIDRILPLSEDACASEMRGEWQPINSLPHDGTIIRAKTADGREMDWPAALLTMAMGKHTPTHLRFPATHWKLALEARMTDQIQSTVEALAQAIFMEGAVAQHNALLAHLDAVENEPKTSPRPWRLNPEWLAHRGCGAYPSPILDANNEEVFDISEWLYIKDGDLDLILTAVNGIPPGPAMLQKVTP